MGYYANGDGSILFSRTLTEEEGRAVKQELEENSTLEYLDFSQLYSNNKVYVTDCEKYHGEDVLTSLNKLNDIVPIKEGEIDYTGEDGSVWCIKFVNGFWNEYDADVYYCYDTLTPNRLKDILVSYVSNDLDTADVDYVKEVLINVCGLTREEANDLGWDWVYGKEDN